MAERTVSVKLKADVAAYMASMRAAGRATGDLEKVSRELRTALRDEEDAAGRVRVAQAKLDEVRKNAKTSVSQLAKAEEDLANAHRKLEAAQERSAAAQQKFAQAQEKVGADAGEAFGRGYERETSKVAKRANAQFSALMAVGLSAGGGAAAGVGAVVSAAAIVGTTAALLGLSAAALSADQDVKGAFNDMTASVKADALEMAAPLKGPLIQSIDRVKGAFHDMAPALQRDVAATVPALDHLTSGVINMGRAALPGISALATTSTPVFRGLQNFLEHTGAGFTAFAGEVAGSSGAVEHDLETLGQVVETLLGSLGGIVSNLASNTRAVDVFAQLIEEAARTLELLTANGGAAMSMLTGFGSTAAGLLHILNGVLSLLNMLPSGVSEFIGMLLAGMLIAKQFGFSVKDAFTSSGDAASGWRNKVGAAIAILAALGAAARLMATEVQRGQTTVDGLSTSLQRWNSNGKVSGDLAKLFGTNLRDMNDAFTILNSGGLQGALENTTDFVGNLIGVDSRLDDAKSRVKQLDEAMASMVRNNQGPEAAQLFQRIAEQAGISMEDLRKLLPGFTAAQAEAAGATKQAASTVKDLGEQAKTAAAHVQTLMDSLNNLVQPELDARSAARELQKAIDDATGSLKENGKNLDITTEKGRANQEALDEIASSTNGLVQALVKSGASQRDVAARMDEGRGAFIKSATAMGMSRQQAEQLATQLGLLSSKDYDVVMGANVQPATDRVNNFLAFASASSATAQVFANADPASGAVKNWQNVTNETVGNTTTYTYTDPATGAVTRWKVETDRTGAKTTTYSWTDPATGAVYAWKRMADGTWAQVNANANTGPANAALDYAARNRTSTITVRYVTGSAPTAGGGTTAKIGQTGQALGGVVKRMAGGGVLGFAAGGHELTPMSPIAQKVPPNTWRVVGDNLSVPEYYIPANGSARSKNILAQAVMDPKLRLFANGGILDAAKEALARISSGGQFFEDFSFYGNSDNLRTHNDELANMYYQAGRGFDRGGITRWLTEYVASQSRGTSVQQAIRNGGAVVQSSQRGGGNAVAVTNHFHFQNYVGSQSELIRAIREKVSTSGGNVQKVLGR